MLRSVVLEEAVSKRGGGGQNPKLPPKKDKKVTFSGLNFGVGGWGHRCRTFFLPKNVFFVGRETSLSNETGFNCPTI